MMRLDVALYSRGLARSRTHAANLIALGRVFVGGVKATKAGQNVAEDAVITLSDEADFASLGGLKLQHALQRFGVTPAGRYAVDIGASNGGFTDVLLQNGAKCVWAVDVAACQLPPALRCDARVKVLEFCNARYLAPEDIGCKVGFISVDVSFISLTHIAPRLPALLTDGGVVMALVKPQFEVGRANLTKSGVVKHARVAQDALTRVTDVFRALGFSIVGTCEAPHPFPDKNQEYFLCAIWKVS